LCILQGKVTIKKEKNMIYFLCPDVNFPSGGIKVIYQFVELLNENGIQSSIIHNARSSPNWQGRVTWFNYDASKAPIVYIQDGLAISSIDDIFVLPEGYGKFIVTDLNRIRAKKKVVLAQSWSYIIPSFQYQSGETIKNWKSYGINDVIATSLFIKEFVKKIFNYASERVHHVQIYPDPVFNPMLKSNDFEKEIEFNDKEPIVIFNSRKHLDNTYMVLLYFQQIYSNHQWRFLDMNSLNQEEFANNMKKAAIFLNTSPEEGFGIQLLEAFGTKTISVGCSGLGSTEFFGWSPYCDHTNSIWGTVEKLYDAVKFIESRNEKEWINFVSQQLSIFHNYNREKTRNQLFDAFTKIENV
jgi:hypothetical protein